MAAITLRPVSAIQDSEYNNTWKNIANAYDTDTSTSSTFSITGSGQGGFVKNTVSTIFNFDTSVIPANAVINSATLTVRAKSSAATNLYISVDANGDSSKRIMNETLMGSTSTKDYTGNATDYIKGLNNISLTHRTAGSSTRTFTCYDIRIDVDYTAYEMPKPTYTVTFKDWDGFTLKTQIVEEGASATAPNDPTRTGYTFIGWDVAFDNVLSDLTVTAQYEEIIDPEEPEDEINNIKLGSDTIENMYIGDSRIIQMYLNGQPLM